MTDNKQWLEFWIGTDHSEYSISNEPWDDIDCIKVIEHVAYQSEKQRADSLQEKLDDEADLLVKTHNKLMEQRQRADRLEKENQKLKEALEKKLLETEAGVCKDLFDDVCCERDTALAENQKLKEALEFYKELPRAEQDQYWTQELAQKCIDVANEALK